MPCHSDRVRRNYCEHEWKETYGVDICDMYVFAKICIKCNKIIKLGYFPGEINHIDNIPQRS